MNRTDGRGKLGLQVIGGFKLLTGLLIFGLGVGLFRVLKGDPAAEVEHLVSALKLDPENRHIHSAIAWVSGVSPRQLAAIRLGTFAYASLYLVEGTGLLLKKRWAEYFTVLATGALIPLEVYEIWRRPTPIRWAILAINLAIVGYLIYQLIRRPGEGAGAEKAPAPTIT